MSTPKPVTSICIYTGERIEYPTAKHFSKAVGENYNTVYRMLNTLSRMGKTICKTNVVVMYSYQVIGYLKRNETVTTTGKLNSGYNRLSVRVVVRDKAIQKYVRLNSVMEAHRYTNLPYRSIYYTLVVKPAKTGLTGCLVSEHYDVYIDKGFDKEF